jgi:hypothetical protein
MAGVGPRGVTTRVGIGHDPATAIAACPPPRAARSCVAIPDGTRPVPVGAALEALAPWLGPDPTAVVGLGLHRPMRPDELPRTTMRLVQHDPDDTVATRTVDGIPGAVSRHLLGAGAVLGIGIVELHQYAGFSGGHKAVAVGLGGRATLDALHHRDRVVAPGVALGRLDGNPFRAAVDALGEAAECAWTLCTTGAAWFAGPPRAVVHAAAASLRCWEDMDRAAPELLVRVRGPKAANLYQASRGATYVALSDAPPLHPGGTILLDAACPEGMGDGDGERAFADVLARHPPPWDALLDGPAPVGAGTQRAVMLALLARRYRLVVCGVLDPSPLRACGLEATAAPAESLVGPDALVVEAPFSRLPRLRTRAT